MNTAAKYLSIPFAAAFALLASGCGESENPEPETDSSLESSTNDLQEQQEPRKVVLLNWLDYISQDAVDLFQEETGITVEIKGYDSTEELRAQLESDPGAYDVVITDNVTANTLNELSLLSEIEADLLPNFSHLAPRFTGLPLDPDNSYTVPYHWGTVIFAVRTDLVEIDDMISWNIFGDERYRDRVAMLDEPIEMVAIGNLLNGVPGDSIEPQDIEDASKTIGKMAAATNLQFFPPWEMRDKLDAGDLWIGQCYSCDGAMWADSNENIAYFTPEEGATLWIDTFQISRDTSRSSEAHEFINFMHRPDVAAMNANYVWSLTPNKSARPMLEEELLADKSLNPSEEILSRCVTLKGMTADYENGVNRFMRNVLAMREATSSEEPTAAVESAE